MAGADVAQVLREKVAYLNQVIDWLRMPIGLPFEEYRKDLYRCLAVERLCQIAVEASTDLCALALELKDELAPAGARRTIEAARQMNIISGSSWAVLDEYVRVRNEIVHEYDSLIDQEIYNEAHGFVDKLPAFISEMLAYLDGQQHESGKQQ